MGSFTFNRKCALPVWVVLVLLLTTVSACEEAAGVPTSGEAYGLFWVALIIILAFPAILGRVTYRMVIDGFDMRAARAVIARAEEREKLWCPRRLERRAMAVYAELNQRWLEIDAEGSKPFLHPDYEEAYLAKLGGQKRGDAPADQPELNPAIRANIHMAQCYPDESQDLFVATFDGFGGRSMRDNRELIGRERGRLSRRQQHANEYWTFMRNGGEWLLCDIGYALTPGFNDISIDAHLIAGKQSQGEALEKAVLWAIKAKKFARKMFAFCAGLLVALFGYYLYFTIFTGVWSLITGWF